MASTSQPPPVQPGRAGLFADLPFDAPDSIAGWLTAAGGWGMVVAFLLPWLSSPFLSYFEAWGFFRPSQLPVFVLVLLMALLTITPARLAAARVRLGYLPLVVAAAGLGLLWDRLDPIETVGAGGWLFGLGGALALVGALWTLLEGERRAETT
ncbi:MAG TPA: hypothetical protein VFK38_03445 [Candidatus Limnocylindrales bacterium]|nr:hypothetical protein [Candidatus Limnocylindrales bacterium]